MELSGIRSQRAYSPELFLCKGLEHLQIFRLKEAPGTNPLWLPKDPRELPQTFRHMRAQWGDNGSAPASWLSPDTVFASTSLLPGESGGLPSMGSHRVGHDWSNLAAAAAAPRGSSTWQIYSLKTLLLLSSPLLKSHALWLSHFSCVPNYNENSLAVEVLSHFFIVLPALALVLAHGKFFLESTFKAVPLITSSLHAKVREKRVRNSEKRKVRWWGKAKSRRLKKQKIEPRQVLPGGYVSLK